MGKEKVSIQGWRPGVVIVGALAMFGAGMLWYSYVHYPVLENLCASSCTEVGFERADVDAGYVATSIMEGCECKRRDLAAGTEDIREGYFFTSNGFLDWFLLIWFRLLPLAVILFLFVFTIAKLVGG